MDAHCGDLVQLMHDSGLRDCCTAHRVIELERLRIADLRDNQEIHERLEAEVLTAWGLREALAEHKMDSRQ